MLDLMTLGSEFNVESDSNKIELTVFVMSSNDGINTISSCSPKETWTSKNEELSVDTFASAIYQHLKQLFANCSNKT